MSVFKILEINVISAQDLPPVSKMLRTFAAVYVDPSQKLTTRVDHQGNSNPTWNYKVAFHVDERFLKSEFSAVTVEIYNVAWLRDLPIGTTQLFINGMSPSLQKNSALRRVKLQIRGASGHLQGTLNLGVQLIDNSTPEYDEAICVSRPISNVDEDDERQLKEENDYEFDDTTAGPEQGIPSDDRRHPTNLIASKIDNLIIQAQEEIDRTAKRPESEAETENCTKTAYSNSMFSAMRPLTSEIAADMKKWRYSNDGEEYGSSVFENWSEKPVSVEKEERELQAKILEWQADEAIPLKPDGKKSGSHDSERRSKGKKRLFSFFGNAYGFEFNFICGSKNLKKKKREEGRKKNRTF